MNTKAQSPISVFFVVLVFIIVWAGFLGKFFIEWGKVAVRDYGATGVWAFFVTNLNLWVFLVLVLFIVSYGYFSQ